ncbi:YciI family protein [Nocardioides aurantiacus]|uniref:YciI family protein n=1 Tax=Nocardioides aurantiacus TaxID=86796 RepID=UPI00403FA23B
MTQYLLSVHTDFDAGAYGDEAEMQQAFAQVDAFNTELQASGSWVFAGGLTPPSDATVVDASGTDAVLTDGPYAETKEVLGGFWIIDVADLDAALEVARKASAACMGKVEVRPFQGE